jgi:hypothetical protein
MWYKSIHYIPCLIRTVGQSGIRVAYYNMHQETKHLNIATRHRE